MPMNLGVSSYFELKIVLHTYEKFKNLGVFIPLFPMETEGKNVIFYNRWINYRTGGEV